MLITTSPLRLLSLGAAALMATSGAIGPAAAATSQPVRLTFDDVASRSSVSTPVNSGSADVSTRVVTAHGGTLTSVDHGDGSAVRMPRFDPESDGPRAVVSLTDTSGADDLAPGGSDFSWGADFTLDSTSLSKATSSTDNGDNLVQRGLWSSQSQFKLELDARRPTCRVKGSKGSLQLALQRQVAADTWYRVTCARSGKTLSVTLSQYGDDGSVAGTWSATARNADGIGAVSWETRSVPLSVGGKLSDAGKLVGSASDQFNGVVDNAFLRISE